MERRKSPLWAKVFFVIYAAVMIWLLFGQRLGYPRTEYGEYFAQNIILTPFRTITRFIGVLRDGGSFGGIIHAFVNLLGNIVMFIPLGLLLPLVRTKRMGFWRCMTWCALIIIFVEGLQLVTMLGTCDIDDLILNMMGAAEGYLLYKLYEIKTKR